MATKNIIFELGDRVKIIDRDSSYSGLLGVIQRVADSEGDFRVAIPEKSDYCYVKRGGLKFLKRATKLKIGDKVRVIGSYDSNFKTEKAVLVEERSDNRFLFKCEDANSHRFGDTNTAYAFDMELLGKRKAIKQPKVNFLLKYDLDSDPIEEFETMPQVKKRIKELSTRSDLRKDSIKVYLIKSVKAVQIKRNISIIGL